MDVATPELPPPPDPGVPDEVQIQPGPCAGLVDGDPCDDGSVCTTGDACQGGFCVSSGTLDCPKPQGLACQSVQCDASKGCTQVPSDDEADCSLACFDKARCISGVCTGVAGAETTCDVPEDPCVAELLCDPELDACTVKAYQLACPEGYLCFAPEQAALKCLGTHTTLCMPCDADVDCAEAAFPSNVNLCLSHGVDGAFCAADCSSAGCPDGYDCELLKSVDGVDGKACVRSGGAACECNPAWAAMGLTTACYAENEFGSCGGIRGCAVGGLTACDAPVPAIESCDGKDNDCDGQVDNAGGESCGQLGACCLETGCQVQYQKSCQDQGGSYKGIGLACTDVSCGGAVKGACCRPDLLCEVVSLTVCQTIGAQYQGDNKPCEDANCGAPQMGAACCLSDGTCTQQTPFLCSDLGGIYQGQQTKCASTTCPLLGACCLSDLSCESASEAQCGESGGNWAPGDCSASSCVLKDGEGACCLQSGACLVVGSDDCAAFAGSFLEKEPCTDQCSAPDVGICCTASGDCLSVAQAECPATAQWKGADGTCAQCTGACCVNDTCVLATDSQCDQVNGLYKGDASVCPEACQ